MAPYTYFGLDVGRKIGATLTGDVTWNDSNKAIFGTGGDATISYDGTNMLVNPAVVGSGEFRVGTSSNYMAIQADGDMKFAGTALYRVGTNTSAFVADANTSAGLFFTSVSGVNAYSFTDLSGVNCVELPVDSAARFTFGVAYSITSPAQITADQNNYSLGNAGYARINSDAARAITGIVAPTASLSGNRGKFLFITNNGSQTITFNHLDTNSTITNRIIGIAAANTALTAGQNMGLVYDGTSNRWRILFVQ